MEHENKTVVLTGFGLFREYKINPSWEAVKLVNENLFDLNFVKIQIPVAYEAVEKAVDEIWNKYNPILVIHCGVHGLANGIRLEKRAVLNTERYCQPDVQSCLPKSCSKSRNQKRLKYLCCDLNLEQIRVELDEHFHKGHTKLNASVSESAGEFLCEYIYRCSLQTNPRQTLFVHVPNVSEELTAQNIAECLEIILKSALEQINRNSKR